MSEIKSSSGFDFYESMRYFLPGMLLVFLFGYIAFPEYGCSYDITEKLAFSVLVGFAIHPFGMYKFVPGVSDIRKQFHNNLKHILIEIDDTYMRWDIASGTMTDDERQYFRRYFALGAFKLDLTFIMMVFLIYYIFSSILDTISLKSLDSINKISLIIPAVLIILIYIIRDDGINDLRRAFNFDLMILLSNKESGTLDDLLRIVVKNKNNMITRERIFLHPIDAIVHPISNLIKHIKNILKIDKK